MQLLSVGIRGYRSIRSQFFRLKRLNVFVGENGVGKTNLYRGLELVQAAAAGTLTRELAAEGGMDGAYWAGPRKKNAKVRIKLSVELGDIEPAYAYSAETGVPPLHSGPFLLEPHVKQEHLSFLGKRPLTLLERRGPVFYARDEAGVRCDLETRLLPGETALGSLSDPGRFPDLHATREALLQWRFYHGFRTDADSPLRRPGLAVTTPTLASDGTGLAAVFRTIMFMDSHGHALAEVVDDAFPGARLVTMGEHRDVSFGLTYREFPQRVFNASELSDGTLRFLALAGALLAWRPPSLIALNEPETSLHPDLLPPLARLIARAAERTQVWVVTHSRVLADGLEEATGIRPRRVYKQRGETMIEGAFLPDDDDEDED